MLDASPPTARLTQAHIATGTLYADRAAALEHLPRGGVVAEVGVGCGDFSQIMLDALRPSAFHAIDLFPWQPDYVLWGRRAEDTLQGKTHHEYFVDRFAASIADGQTTVHVGDSAEILATLPERHFDVIYIDGDHTLEGVRRDADAAARILKPDGFLVFNDYVLFDYIDGRRYDYGIVPVVNELCVRHGWRVEYLALETGMHCDICIRKGAPADLSV